MSGDRPRVYNKHVDKIIPADAVYVGRPSKWGNAYSHLPADATHARFRVATREAAIEAYARDLLAQPVWMSRARHELRGKDLVCWCSPARCHGDVLLAVANAGDDVLIDSFRGKFEFLSNFYTLPRPIVYGGAEVWTTEAAYQAAKAIDVEDRLRISAMRSPGATKRAGRQLKAEGKQRPDWERVNGLVMLDLLRLKFEIPELRELLLATGKARLVEGNHWHDSWWGSCTCGKCPVGHNNLGRLHEQVRSECGTCCCRRAGRSPAPAHGRLAHAPEPSDDARDAMMDPRRSTDEKTNC